MLTTNKKLLQKAQKGTYGIPAFNINNLEFLQAIMAAAEAEQSPVIIATSEGGIKYAGMDQLVSLVKNALKESSIPGSLHVDHGRDLDLLKQAIKMGYTSLMYDGSHLSFEENVRNTKKVVGWAHKKGISVEGELGTIGGAEDAIVARHIIYTDPDEAVEFVQKTGIDSFAVAIGTSHGVNKFAGKSSLNFKLLKELQKKIKIPLVLHGASGIPHDIVELANRYGATLKNTMGVAPSQVRRAVSMGICKVNIDSDLRLSFDAGLRRQLSEHPDVFDPRKILAPATKLVAELAASKMRLLGSSGKA